MSRTGKVTADARLADLSLNKGNGKQAATYRKRAYKAYSPGLAKKDAAMRDAVAQMVFNAVDRSYQRYMQIALGDKIDNAVVKAKSKLLETLEKGFHEVVQYQSPNWTLAALYRSYEINRVFELVKETSCVLRA